MVRPGEVVQICVGSLGIGGVKAQGPTQLPQPVQRFVLQPGQGIDAVRHPGVPQLRVAREAPAGQTGGVQYGGSVQPNPVGIRPQAASRHRSRRGLHKQCLAGQAVFVAVAADAPGSVAAHFAHGSVGIVKAHAEIAPGQGVFHGDEAVGADGKSPAAQFFGQLTEPLLRKTQLPVVQNDKVIPRAVHFPKFHPISSRVNLRLHSVGAGYIRPGGENRFKLRTYANS